MTYVNDVNKIEMYIHVDWTLRGTPTKYAHFCAVASSNKILLIQEITTAHASYVT